MTRLRGLAVSVFFCALTFCMTTELEAQQYLQLTQFMLNKYALNPAFAGLEHSLSITGTLRSQWNQLNGSPKTQIINAHLPLYYLNGSIGMSLENDQTGALKRTLFSASYNYVMESQIGIFSLGFKAGVQQIRLNADELRTPTGSYQDLTIDHNDPILSTGIQSGLEPLWGMGFYMVIEGLEGGLTFDNIPANNFTGGDAQFKSTTFSTFFLTYTYGLDESTRLMPSLLVKSDFAQTQTDIGILWGYNELFGGVSLRGYNSDSLDALNIIIGTKLNEHFRVSYSFDLGISGLTNVHDGTHEFNVNYNLNKKIKTGELPKIIYNPRYN